MAGTSPITHDEFAAAMAGLGLSPSGGPFAVAVSGGPDSMALSMLFAKWANAEYLTFDHNMRAESGHEARQTGKWLKEKGLSHHTLVWEGKKPTSNIAAAARDARYAALGEWCRERGIKALVLAHTMDDQAETFLMRLFRGSGVDGLAAMAPVTGENPKLVRPLLGVRKASLIAFLEKENQEWFEDPTNENLDYTRIKIRKLLAASDIKGLDAETLAATAARMGRVRTALQSMTGDLLQKIAAVHDAGYVALDPKGLAAANEEIGLRALSKILMFISQADYPPRFEGLERLFEEITGKTFKGATLHGCHISRYNDNQVLVCREADGIVADVPIDPGAEILWDKRFKVKLENGRAGIVIKALGAEGWQRMAGDHPEIKENELPLAVKTASPALCENGGIVAIPQLGFFAKGISATLEFDPEKPLYC